MLGAVERDEVHRHEIRPLLAQYCRGEARAHQSAGTVVVVAVDEWAELGLEPLEQSFGAVSARSSFTSSSLTARQNSGIK